MSKRIIAALFCMTLVIAMTACAPDDVDQDREPKSTTGRAGGFVIEDKAPGYDEEWNDLSVNSYLDAE